MHDHSKYIEPDRRLWRATHACNATKRYPFNLNRKIYENVLVLFLRSIHTYTRVRPYMDVLCLYTYLHIDVSIAIFWLELLVFVKSIEAFIYRNTLLLLYYIKGSSHLLAFTSHLLHCQHPQHHSPQFLLEQ